MGLWKTQICVTQQTINILNAQFIWCMIHRMENLIQIVINTEITLGIISQLVIMCTGIVAAWLSQDHRYNHRKHACLIALVGQPFWWYSTYIAEQWGIFIMSLFYTFAWMKGTYNYWIKKR